MGSMGSTLVSLMILMLGGNLLKDISFGDWLLALPQYVILDWRQTPQLISLHCWQ
jgi:hypothetical protein